MRSAAVRTNYEQPQWPPTLYIGNRFSQSTNEPIRVQRPQVTPSTAEEPAWIRPAIDRMGELLRLGADWDHRGSAEVRCDTLSFAWNILTQIMPPTAAAPGMIPLGNGGVQLIWNNANSDLEVEVVAPNEVYTYWLDKMSGAEYEDTLTTDFSSVTEILWSRFKV